MQPKGFYGIFTAPSTMDFRYIARRRRHSLHTLMPTGLAARTHASPPPVTAFFLVIIWYPGLRSANKLSLGLVQRLNIVVLPTSSPRHAGYASSCPSSTDLFKELLWSTVTTSPPSTFRRIRFNINVPSMWRLTYILFMSVFLWRCPFSTFDIFPVC